MVTHSGAAEQRGAAAVVSGGAGAAAGKAARDESAALLRRSEDLWRPYWVSEESVASKALGGRTARIMRSAKRRHRTDLRSRDWGVHQYHLRWEALREELRAQAARSPNQLPVLHGASITMREFHERFERPLIPCVIEGLADAWPARTEWNLSRLRRDFGERSFKCGEDDEGYPVKVKLKHFLRYQSSADEGGAKLDDSPLYIFDSHYDDDKVGKQLLDEYTVPHLFDEDLFSLVGLERRPPHRWVLFGPARSGSNVHIDPLGTSAWNTLVRGHKLWTLFPPDVPRAVVKGREHVNWKTEDDEPIDWNVNLLPRILRAHPELRGRVIQFVQRPGQTMFVPSNWWHAVLNLDTTIAVTQNFCSTGNFDTVWKHTRMDRKKLARSWLRFLREWRPDLAQAADRADARDGYDLGKAVAEAKAKSRAKKDRKEAKERRKRDGGMMGGASDASSSSSEGSTTSSDDERDDM
jgi:histone arginine demethylase JMJD6